MRFCTQLFAFTILSAPLYAQAAPQYRFEVASIKPSKSVDGNSRFGPGSQGGIRGENITTLQMITFAYDVRPFQIVGAPKWVESDRWDVIATPERPEEPPSANSSRTQFESFIGKMRQRVQTLLAERYKLTIRQDTREMPVIGLGVRKEGHKLTPAVSEHPFNMSTGRSTMKASAVTMKIFTDALSGVLSRPVLDETGLTGIYDFKMEWTPEPPPGEAAPPESGPSIFTAIQEQLGLRLDAKRAPAPVFVIEGIEKPSEN